MDRTPLNLLCILPPSEKAAYSKEEHSSFEGDTQRSAKPAIMSLSGPRCNL